MWPQNPYIQQPYQYNQPMQGPYSNITPMANNQIPTEVVDWDTVSSIDPDLIRMTGDLTQLQPFISRFVAVNLSAYESQILSHPLSVRLCSILQVSLQHMSDVQKELQAKVDEKDRIISKQQRDYRKLLATYSKADELLKRQMKPSERCPLCLKRFKNFDYLDSHIEKRHPEHLDEWLSIRNKKPIEKQRQNDIDNIMERIEELRKSIKKDREKRSHHHNRHGNDENIQTLQQELQDQQDKLMATEAIEDELLMTKRDDLKGELNSAVDDLNASWIAWSNNNNNNNAKKSKPKLTKEEDELNNMYKVENEKTPNQFDQFEDQFELDNNFGNCDSSDDYALKYPDNDQNQIGNFQFAMVQNNDVPFQQQQTPQKSDENDSAKNKSKKSAKKPKHSFFRKKKSSKENLSKENLSKENNLNMPDSNVNEIEVSQSSEKVEPQPIIKPKKIKKQKKKSVPLPKKKVLPDDIKDLITKARTIVVRKFIPNYDESTVSHVMKSIEKKMNGFKKQYANNNETAEQVTNALQSTINENQNDYFAARRRVLLKIDNEAPVKHCTLYNSSFLESSSISVNEQNDEPNENQQNISPSSISHAKKNEVVNDETPKPANPHYTASDSNYASTPYSQQTTPQRERRKEQNEKTSYSYITYSSNVNEAEKQTQSKPNDKNENPEGKKLKFVNRPPIQCKKHFKSEGHTVQSPFPMLSGTPSSNKQVNNRNNANITNSTMNNSVNNNNSIINASLTSNVNTNYTDNYGNSSVVNASLTSNINCPNGSIVNTSLIDNNNNNYNNNNYNDHNYVNSSVINPSLASNINSNYNDAYENGNALNNNEAVNNGQMEEEDEYYYEEEEEEVEMPQNNQVDQFEAKEEEQQVNNDGVNQEIPFEEEEEETSYINNNNEEKSEAGTNELPNKTEQTFESESFNISSNINKKVINPPNLGNRPKNEITSSTDVFVEPPKPHQTNNQYLDQDDSLNQSDNAKVSNHNSAISNSNKNSSISNGNQNSAISGSGKNSAINNSNKNSVIGNSNQNSAISNNKSSAINNSNQNSVIGNNNQNSAISGSGKNSAINNSNKNSAISNSNKNSVIGNSSKNSAIDNSGKNSAIASRNKNITFNNKANLIKNNNRNNPINNGNKNRVINFVNNQNESSEYEYYSDEEGSRSDGEVASYHPQKEQVEQIAQEVEISKQVHQSQVETDLEPFIVSYETPPLPSNSSYNGNSKQKPDSNMNPESYSNSSENHFFKFDSTTNSKSRVSTNEDPIKGTIYQTQNVGSMDNIVSFDEVKSIDNIENIAKVPAQSNHSISTDDSQFNFDSLIEKTSGGDSFITSSHSNKFDQSNSLNENSKQQESPQSIDPSSYNNVSPSNDAIETSSKNENSFFRKQKNILASKYGMPPSAQNNYVNQANVQANPVKVVNVQEEEEYVYEEEEEEEELDDHNLNTQKKNEGPSGIAKKFNVIDLFKPSGNSSLLKSQKSNNKSFLGTKLQKTFAGSSSAAAEDDDFDYNRGPHMANDSKNFMDDEMFSNDFAFKENKSNSSLSKTTDKELTFKSNSTSKYVDDSEGPPTLSKKKNPDSVISNDDFDL